MRAHLQRLGSGLVPGSFSLLIPGPNARFWRKVLDAERTTKIISLIEGARLMYKEPPCKTA